jgi:hypothetical protein
VLCFFDEEVRRTSHNIPEADEDINQDGDRVSFRVRINRVDDVTGEPDESIRVKRRPWGCRIPTPSTVVHVRRGFCVLRRREVSDDAPDVLGVVRGRALRGEPEEHGLDLLRFPADGQVVPRDLSSDGVTFAFGDSLEALQPIVELASSPPLLRGLTASEVKQPLRCRREAATIGVT